MPFTLWHCVADLYIQVTSLSLGRYQLGICMSQLKDVQDDRSPQLQQPSYQGPIVHAGAAAQGD